MTLTQLYSPKIWLYVIKFKTYLFSNILIISITLIIPARVANARRRWETCASEGLQTRASQENTIS